MERDNRKNVVLDPLAVNAIDDESNETLSPSEQKLSETEPLEPGGEPTSRGKRTTYWIIGPNDFASLRMADRLGIPTIIVLPPEDRDGEEHWMKCTVPASDILPQGEIIESDHTDESPQGPAKKIRSID